MPGTAGASCPLPLGALSGGGVCILPAPTGGVHGAVAAAEKSEGAMRDVRCDMLAQNGAAAFRPDDDEKGENKTTVVCLAITLMCRQY